MNRMTFPKSPHRWKKFAALAIFAALLLSVSLPGFAVLYRPLRKLPPEWCFVAELDQLPASGAPHRYPLVRFHQIAWETPVPRAVSSVYLRRLPDSDRVVALSAISPWLGCHLKYSEEQHCFSCVGHLHEDYDLSGQRFGSDHPAPRDMDELETVVREGQVWVRFQLFKPGLAQGTAEYE